MAEKSSPKKTPHGDFQVDVCPTTRKEPRMRFLPILSESEQPSSYFDIWMATLPMSPIEHGATCERCAMIPYDAEPRPETTTFSFRSDVKCCTYMPSLPNFLAGGVIMEQRSLHAKEVLASRIDFGSGVTPLYVERTALFAHVYDAARSAFGRSASLRCPYFDDNGRCGIWAHRDSTCFTWFCKHGRGKLGWEYWDAVRTYFQHVEQSLAIHAALSLGVSPSTIGKSMQYHRTASGERVVSEIVECERASLGPLPSSYNEDWSLYFADCARFIRSQSTIELFKVLGSKGQALRLVVEERAKALTEGSWPSRMKLGKFSIKRLKTGFYQLISFSENDPVAVSSDMWDYLSLLDDTTLDDLIRNAPSSTREQLTPQVIRTLMDYGILVAVG